MEGRGKAGVIAARHQGLPVVEDELGRRWPKVVCRCSLRGLPTKSHRGREVAMLFHKNFGIP